MADLEAAIEGNEIEVLFQPQVEIATQSITGVEALARWRHPHLGELGPNGLLAIAAQSQMMTVLSRHIQDRALSVAAHWPETMSALRLSINVTSEDIAEAAFVDDMLGRIERTGFEAARLTLEITEANLIDDLPKAAKRLETLRGHGIRTAIDDFGTGYSSFAYLRALPVDILKIDADFTQAFANEAKARIIVSSFIALARVLGLAVVAEGVETQEQLALLTREGCDYYQGFLCAEAIDSTALENLLKTRG